MRPHSSHQAFHGVSERRSCLTLGVDRSSIRYVSHKPDQAPLRLRIHDPAAAGVRYGSFRIYIVLRREGWLVNHQCGYRLYREDGLRRLLRRTRRNVSAAIREGQPAASAPNDMWSMDFDSDALFDGRRLPALPVVDAFTREALAIDVDQGIKGAQVVAAMADRFGTLSAEGHPGGHPPQSRCGGVGRARTHGWEMASTLPEEPYRRAAGRGRTRQAKDD